MRTWLNVVEFKDEGIIQNELDHEPRREDDL